MNKNSNQNLQITQANVFTNSVIDINIPNDSQSQKKMFLIWESIGHKSTLSPTDNRNIQKKRNTTTYICSPLDYGQIISVAIKESQHGEVVQKMNYGPIKIQKKLTEEIKNHKNLYSVKVILNKNQSYPALLRLYDKIDEIKLSVKINNKQDYIINLDEVIKNNPSKGMIRTYSNEPNCIGVYINHQYKSFMSLMNEFKICYHYGHYLKINLQDRITRDILLCQLLKRSGFIIDEIDKSLMKKNNFDKSKINVKLGQIGNVNKKNQIKENQQVKVYVQIKQNKFFNLKEKIKQNNNNSQKNDSIIPQNIIDDIHKILYSPQLKQQNLLKQKQFVDQKNDKKQKTYMLKSQCVQPISLNSIQNIENQKQQKKIHVNDSQSITTLKNFNQSKYQYQTFKKKTGSMIFDQEIQENHNLNHLTPRISKINKNIFANTINELDVNQKIYDIIKMNEDLLIQNALLKEQNLKLRYQKIKHNTPQDNKMYQIKSMVKAMADRLQVLQHANNNKSQQNFTHKNHKNINNTFRPGIIQNQERSNSPYTKNMMSQNITQNYSKLSYDNKIQNKRNKQLEWNGTKTEQIKTENIIAEIQKVRNVQHFNNLSHFSSQKICLQNRQSPENYNKLMKCPTLHSPQHRRPTQASQLKSPIKVQTSNSGKIMKPPIIYFQG